MTDIKNRLISNFPITIKDNNIFNALIGAEANSLKNMLDYTKEYTTKVNVYSQDGDMLSKTISFFSFLERLNGESEDGLKNRFAALFVRNNISPWGTIYSIKKVFKQYFQNAEIYVQENTRDISENLIVDGDFEENSTLWNFNKCNLTDIDKFSGQKSVLFSQNSSLSQMIALEKNNCYTVHFFMKGEIKIKIKNTTNKYWDFENLTWTTENKAFSFNSNTWKNQSVFFIPNTDSVTVFFEGSSESYLDYVEVYKKKKNATFTVVCQFTGTSADGALVLAPGSNDPVNEKIDRSMYGYYDHTFFTGLKTGFAKDVYNDLLQYLKPVGVQAFLNILVKER